MVDNKRLSELLLLLIKINEADLNPQNLLFELLDETLYLEQALEELKARREEENAKQEVVEDF